MVVIIKILNIFARMFSHEWVNQFMLKATELTCAAFTYMYQHQYMTMFGKAVRKGIIGI